MHRASALPAAGKASQDVGLELTWSPVGRAPCELGLDTVVLSQEAFADVLGVHRTYMGGIERGERNLTLKSLERISARLGLDPLGLLTTNTP